MLKINTKVKKYKIPAITCFTMLGSVFLFQYLTFIPNYSSAESISTPIYDKNTKPDDRTLSQITYMQEMTSGICGRSAIGEEKLNIIDNRDSSTYNIKKLSDGRCWMTQNLRIVNKTITPTDSDVTANYTVPASSEPWKDTSNTANRAHYAGDETYGAYYSWHVATASTGPDTSGEAPSSICPKGWKLPTSTNTGQFQTLVTHGKSSWTTSNNFNGYWIGGTASSAGAAFFPAAGIIANGSITGVTERGDYWSSTAAISAYSMHLNSRTITPSNSGCFRYFGLSVRCVNNPEIKDAIVEPDVLIPNPNVSVTVDKILTMKLDSSEVNIEPKNGEIMTGDFGATVSSNADYTLSITAAEGASTSLVNQNDNIVIAEIPTISTETSSLTPNENNWAIRLCHDTNKTNCNNYKPITPYGTTNIFLTNGTPTPSTTSLFEVGIGISPALPSGTYSTNILITASQK